MDRPHKVASNNAQNTNLLIQAFKPGGDAAVVVGGGGGGGGGGEEAGEEVEGPHGDPGGGGGLAPDLEGLVIARHAGSLVAQ